MHSSRPNPIESAIHDQSRSRDILTAMQKSFR
jgi:hypothetical protein